MIDTLRLLVSWKCNLKCTYCCNEQEQFHKDIHPTSIDTIPWHQYKVFCVSGGEPLLNMPLVRKVCGLIPKEALTVLYSNGILFNSTLAEELCNLGITAMNIGLHNHATFPTLIERVADATKNLRLSVRFHAQDIFKNELTQRYPFTSFRFWTMNDCDRANEHRVVLT